MKYVAFPWPKDPLWQSGDQNVPWVPQYNMRIFFFAHVFLGSEMNVVAKISPEAAFVICCCFFRQLLLCCIAGLLSDEGLYDLAKMIGSEYVQLATLLRIPTSKQEHIRMDHPGNTLRQIFELLRIWRDNCKGTKEQVKGKLHDALQRCNRADLAEDLLQEVVEGSNEKVNYHSII